MSGGIDPEGVAYGSRWLRAPASNHRSAGPTIATPEGVAETLAMPRSLIEIRDPSGVEHGPLPPSGGCASTRATRRLPYVTPFGVIFLDTHYGFHRFLQQ